ncbi:MAG: hypothetical protein PVH62_08925 [Anaerolineae bacterium]|jgi:uncharacterized membrane protein YeaQ/YmgE (transglycosylase-associated protein family)
MSTLIIWLGIWIVLGLLVGALGGMVARSEPPYGLAVDLVASLLTMIGIGLGDYYILPMMGFSGAVHFAAMVLEPLIGTVLVLWLLRVIKRRKGG